MNRFAPTPSDPPFKLLPNDGGVPIERLLCPICAVPYHHPKVLLCGHTFCMQCIERLPAADCPMCRTPFEGRIRDNYAFADVSSCSAGTVDATPSFLWAASTTINWSAPTNRCLWCSKTCLWCSASPVTINDHRCHVAAMKVSLHSKADACFVIQTEPNYVPSYRYLYSRMRYNDEPHMKMSKLDIIQKAIELSPTARDYWCLWRTLERMNLAGSVEALLECIRLRSNLSTTRTVANGREHTKNCQKCYCSLVQILRRS